MQKLYLVFFSCIATIMYSSDNVPSAKSDWMQEQQRRKMLQEQQYLENNGTCEQCCVKSYGRYSVNPNVKIFPRSVPGFFQQTENKHHSCA